MTQTCFVKIVTSPHMLKTKAVEQIRKLKQITFSLLVLLMKLCLTI